MVNRRKFIKASALSSMALSFGKVAACNSQSFPVKGKAVVISTWDAGLRANKAAWEVLKDGGRALDAVEKGVMADRRRYHQYTSYGCFSDSSFWSSI